MFSTDEVSTPVPHHSSRRSSLFPMGVASAVDGGDVDDTAVLRAKLDDAERRLNSTALELRDALGKIHARRNTSNTSSSPPGSPRVSPNQEALR